MPIVDIRKVGTTLKKGREESRMAAHQSQAEPFERIDVKRAKELVDSGKVALIDVREKDEWEEGYIAGAVHLSVNDIINMKGLEQIPMDKPVVFQCSVGVRSGLAAELAAAIGHPGPLYNMEGGIEAWRAAKYPVVIPAKKK